jgi:hypothetical protein
MLDVAVDRRVPDRHQAQACLGHSAGERYLAVQAGDGEQAADQVPDADRMQAAASCAGPAGHAGQHPQPGGVDEGDPE